MRFWWRVTRFDPAHRDARGAYRRDTWTSIGDVGGSFEDGELTLETYLRVEDAYVEAVAAFADGTGAERLVIGELDYGEGLREGQVLSIAEARDVVRRMLREDVSCKLQSPDGRFAVHVGFDLYMYIGSAEPCTAAVRDARASGLFVEEGGSSPYG